MDTIKITHSEDIDVMAIIFATDREQSKTIVVNDFVNIDVDENGLPTQIEILGVSHLTKNPGAFDVIDYEQYMTVDEVAQHHGVSSQTIYNALSGGKLPGAQKLGEGRGGMWLIPKVEAFAWEADPRGRKKKAVT